MQLRFNPPKQRRKQLESAEKLFAIIDRDKEYPLEFVIFYITGFSPQDLSFQQLIKGNELAEDLQIFISRLSAQLALPASGQKQKIYTIEELAKELDVSTKTIDRWRKRGLPVRKFVFDDGKKRLGFSQSSVDIFLKTNPELITNAKNFTRLANKERKLVIKKAVELTAKASLSRYQIIEKIAAQLGKAHEISIYQRPRR
jgi:RNA polymerase primary sigma factor